MLRNLDEEFRGNGLPDELYSALIGKGAVMHMKNACSPTPRDVKISTSRRAVDAADLMDDIARTGVRHLGDPAVPSAVPEGSEGMVVQLLTTIPSRRPPHGHQQCKVNDRWLAHMR